MPRPTGGSTAHMMMMDLSQGIHSNVTKAKVSLTRKIIKNSTGPSASPWLTPTFARYSALFYESTGRGYGLGSACFCSCGERHGKRGRTAERGIGTPDVHRHEAAWIGHSDPVAPTLPDPSPTPIHTPIDPKHSRLPPLAGHLSIVI